ncbi:hypothetical protein [Paludibacterium yongneupense]|uniref:hypothetical protein n=1 Tax=Paludibacterium yongneupense TaxID=400061 RepID=UPI000416D932|nr:hypothetical protein [Paludibacterium yongneupense]
MQKVTIPAAGIKAYRAADREEVSLAGEYSIDGVAFDTLFGSMTALSRDGESFLMDESVFLSLTSGNC